MSTTIASSSALSKTWPRATSHPLLTDSSKHLSCQGLGLGGQVQSGRVLHAANMLRLRLLMLHRVTHHQFLQGTSSMDTFDEQLSSLVVCPGTGLIASHKLSRKKKGISETAQPRTVFTTLGQSIINVPHVDLLSSTTFARASYDFV